MDVYLDSYGRECTLWELCRREPEWAANRIEALRKELEEVRAERDRWVERFKEADHLAAIRKEEQED